MIFTTIMTEISVETVNFMGGGAGDATNMKSFYEFKALSQTILK